jgi:hypothetical protein
MIIKEQILHLIFYLSFVLLLLLYLILNKAYFSLLLTKKS